MNNNIEMKDIPGYEGIYAITRDGRVWSYRRKKFKSIADGNHGYQQLQLSVNGVHKNVYIHRLVAEAFIPNPYNLPEVNHKDENKRNNSVDNLEWCNRKYNLTYSGHRVPKALYCINNGMFYNSISEASKRLGLPLSSVRMVALGRHKHVHGYRFIPINQEKLCDIT